MASARQSNKCTNIKRLSIATVWGNVGHLDFVGYSLTQAFSTQWTPWPIMLPDTDRDGSTPSAAQGFSDILLSHLWLIPLVRGIARIMECAALDKLDVCSIVYAGSGSQLDKELIPFQGVAIIGEFFSG